MEQMIDRLREIGIDADTLDALQAADDGNAHDTALLLIAMFDDRHEYVD